MFGSSNTSTPFSSSTPFGSSTTSTNTTTPFGSSTFGGTTSTNTNNSNSLFGNTNLNSTFGGTGGGASTAFGSGNTGGGFGLGLGGGSSGNTGFSSGGFGTSSPFGSTSIVTGSAGLGTKEVTYRETQNFDGNADEKSFNFVSITAMPNYQNKSLEQLRFEDYKQNLTGIGATSPQQGIFGLGSSSGVPNTNTSGSLFGGGQTNQNTSSFGSGGLFGTTSQPSSNLFGSSTGNQSSGSLFGSGTNQGSSLFGNTQTQNAQPSSGFGSSSLFGASNTGTSGGLFGSSTNASTGSSLFGQNTASTNTGGGLFGNTSSSGSSGLFGKPTTTSSGLFGTGGSSLFGSSGTTSNTSSIFGTSTQNQAPTTSGGLFGTTAAAPSTGGLFGTTSANTNTLSSGSLFGSNTGTSLFGGGTSGNQPAGTGSSGGGLFGGGTTGSSLFGSSSTQTGAGLFGNTGTSGSSLFAPTSNTTNTGSSLFGNTGTAALPANSTGGGLFGTAGSTPNTSIFGSNLEMQTTAQNIPPSQNPGMSYPASSIINNEEIAKQLFLAKDAWSPAADQRQKSSRYDFVKERKFISPGLNKSIRNVSPKTLGMIAAAATDRGSNSAKFSVSGGMYAKALEANRKTNQVTYELIKPKLNRLNGIKAVTPVKLLGDREKFLIDKRSRLSCGQTSSPVFLKPKITELSTLQSREIPKFEEPEEKESEPARMGDMNRPSISTPNILRPVSAKCPKISLQLTELGYKTRPSMKKLMKFTDNQLTKVMDFEIIRDDFGSVLWLGETDVTDLIIDETLIDISEDSVEVYKDDLTTPPVGTKLNKPAIIKIFRVQKPKGFEGTEQEFVQFIKSDFTKQIGGEFIDFIQNSKGVNELWEGTWIFKVAHFTKYGISEEMLAKAKINGENKENKVTQNSDVVFACYGDDVEEEIIHYPDINEIFRRDPSVKDLDSQEVQTESVEPSREEVKFDKVLLSFGSSREQKGIERVKSALFFKRSLFLGSMNQLVKISNAEENERTLIRVDQFNKRPANDVFLLKQALKPMDELSKTLAKHSGSFRAIGSFLKEIMFVYEDAAFASDWFQVCSLLFALYTHNNKNLEADLASSVKDLQGKIVSEPPSCLRLWVKNYFQWCDMDTDLLNRLLEGDILIEDGIKEMVKFAENHPKVQWFSLGLFSLYLFSNQASSLTLPEIITWYESEIFHEEMTNFLSQNVPQLLPLNNFLYEIISLVSSNVTYPVQSVLNSILASESDRISVVLSVVTLYIVENMGIFGNLCNTCNRRVLISESAHFLQCAGLSGEALMIFNVFKVGNPLKQLIRNIKTAYEINSSYLAYDDQESYVAAALFSRCQNKVFEEIAALAASSQFYEWQRVLVSTLLPRLLMDGTEGVLYEIISKTVHAGTYFLLDEEVIKNWDLNCGFLVQFFEVRLLRQDLDTAKSLEEFLQLKKAYLDRLELLWQKVNFLMSLLAGKYTHLFSSSRDEPQKTYFTDDAFCRIYSIISALKVEARDMTEQYREEKANTS